tara:strand:+ start:2857 stop:5265 length:2409 start_codon:yes stop_codon:yes gene_type:complete
MDTNPNNLMDKPMGPGGPNRPITGEEALMLELPEGGAPMGMGLGAAIEMDDGSVEFEESEGVEEEVPFDANLAEIMESGPLGALAGDLVAEYDENKESRAEWEDTYMRGLDLLGYKKEDRTEPFPGACGLTHPLLAEAATQFQAQAFNELLPAKGPVKGGIVGKRTEDKLRQAVRVANFMNYYITEVMEEYTPEFDQLLFQLALAGSAFKKVFFDAGLGRVTSQYIPAENLVVPYHTSSLSTCPSIGQLVPMQVNEIKKLQLKGFYLDDVDVRAGEVTVGKVKEKKNEVEGVSPTQNDYEVDLIEFHVELDLEGFEHVDAEGEPTGLKLPYIVTVVEDSSKVLRISRNYAEGDPEFKKLDYFVHYKFLPGLGFYGFGLTHAIGNMADAAGGILRSLIDAGTFANLPAGYKANGIRIAQSSEPLVPGEFRDIDVPSGKVQDAMMALPFKGPNTTLFQLLGFVVEAGQRFASITDMKVGEGDPQAAVGTTLALLEEGSKVMSAVHKRLHAAMKREFKLLSAAMATQKGLEYPYEVDEGANLQQDFDGKVDVLPVSDPNIFSQTQRITLAQSQLALAKEMPDMHNLYEAYRRMHEAMGTPDVDSVLKAPPMGEPEPKDPASEHIDVLDGLQLKAFDGQDSQAHIESHLLFSSSGVASANPAVMMSLQKHITEHVKIAAEEEASVEFQKEKGTNEPPTEDEKLELEILIAQYIAVGLQQVREKAIEIAQQEVPGEDPVIALKQQEINQDAKEHEDSQALEYEKLENREEQAEARMQSSEKMTQQRLAMQEKLTRMKERPTYNQGPR